MAITDNQKKRQILAGFPEGGVPMTVKSSEVVYAGDLLGAASNVVFPVDSDDAEHGILVAAEAGVAGEIIQCYWGAVIDGFSGGTSGLPVYPAGTAGAYTETIDPDADDSKEIVGYQLDETKCLIIPAARAFTTAGGV